MEFFSFVAVLYLRRTWGFLYSWAMMFEITIIIIFFDSVIACMNSHLHTGLERAVFRQIRRLIESALHTAPWVYLIRKKRFPFVQLWFSLIYDKLLFWVSQYLWWVGSARSSRDVLGERKIFSLLLSLLSSVLLQTGVIDWELSLLDRNCMCSS